MQKQIAEYLRTGEYLERRKTRNEDIIWQDGENTIEISSSIGSEITGNACPSLFTALHASSLPAAVTTTRRLVSTGR